MGLGDSWTQKQAGPPGSTHYMPGAGGGTKQGLDSSELLRFKQTVLQHQGVQDFWV